MKKYLLIVILLPLLIGLANACTISPSSQSGTTEQTLTYTLIGNTGAGENTWTKQCESGGASQPILQGDFTCSYSATGTKTITVTPKDEFGVAMTPCNATATISTTSNQPPTVSI